MMKTSLTIFPCVLGSAFPIIRVCSGLSFATKGLGHLSALYLLLLLVARYNLSYYKTICYLLFQYLQRVPCWKPLIISLCSSLGSTLLLIERTTIDPLYLWVINHMSWIYMHPCMLSNPFRYLDESKSMRLQITHILSNLYITKSLRYSG